MDAERARVFLLDPEVLVQTRRALGLGSELLEPADQRLLQEADVALEKGGLAADLWGWQGTGGRSLRRAFTWLIAQGLDQAWSHPQGGHFDAAWWVPLRRRGARRWAELGAEARLRALPEVDWAGDRTNLLYPPIV